MEKVNLSEKLAQFSDQWKPKIVGELNGQQVKLVKFQGPFVWHHQTYGGPHCLDQKIASLQYSIGYGSSSTYPPRRSSLPQAFLFAPQTLHRGPGFVVRTRTPSPDRQRGVSPGTLPGASGPSTTGAVVPRCRT